MKKSLVALAALAATSAFAQSGVTLYGNLDQSIFRATNAGNSLTSSNSNGGSTSLWGMRGQEDLGGGVKASFDLKSEISLASGQTGSASTSVNTTSTSALSVTGTAPNGGGAITSGTTAAVPAATTSNVFNRGAWVGISKDGFADFKIGRQNDAWWETSTRFNNTGINSFGWANATAMASGTTTVGLINNSTTAPTGMLSGTATAGTAAGQNPATIGTGAAFIGGWSVESPSFSGFKAKYAQGVNKPYYDVSGSSNNVAGYSLSYDQGPLSLAYASTARNDNNGDKAFKNTMIGAKYAMGQYTFTFAQNQTRMGGQSYATHDIDINAFGVGYQLTPAWKIDLGYTVMKDKTDSANKFTQTGLVGVYSFSKRTSWYVGYGQGKNDGNSRLGPVYAGNANAQPLSGNQGTTASAYLTGLRHQF